MIALVYDKLLEIFTMLKKIVANFHIVQIAMTIGWILKPLKIGLRKIAEIWERYNQRSRFKIRIIELII